MRTPRAFILTGLLTCLTSMSVQASEYCLRSSNKEWTEANSVVCCSTPAGWYAWKDDRGLDPNRLKELDPLTKSYFNRLVSFHQPSCREGRECPYLALETRGRDSRGQPDVETGLRDFLNEWEQPQDLRPRNPPCVVVRRFGSFQTENFGTLTIWRIRCPSGQQHLLTLLAQRDALVTVILGAPGIKDIIPKIDSLKELARSVRIIDASQALPDIVAISPHLSDETIKDQLLRLTPVGTPLKQVYDVL